MARDPAKNTPGLVIKRHNIRIWCHDCDMARLQRVVWEGHGARLLSEVSNQPIVKRFLEAVPYIMNTVRDIHQAVVQNDLESVMKNSSDPVPPQILSSRDSNNMTVMHKAAGLGHSSILKYLVERYPQGINDVDNEGRTPLHYAASMRDEQHTYNLLVGLGADESIVDNKHKTPAYYINRPQEIDKTLFRNVPDAPRTASSAYPSTWDWKLLDNDVIAELNKKSRRRNLKASTENLLSKNYTNTISDSTDNRNDVMKASSTHEFISDLPDLDDGSKENKDEEENKQDLDTNKESEENGENNDNEDNKVQENVDNEENEQIVERGENENKHDDEEKQNIEEHHDDKENEVATENHNAEENNESVDTHHSEDIIKNQSYERKEEKDEKEVVTQTGDGKQESKENTVEENDKDPAAKYNEETTSKNTEPTKENIEENVDNAELDNAQSQIKESTENNKENSSKDENEKIESAPERPRTVTKRVPDAEEPNENNNTQRSEDTKSGHVINGRNTQESLIEGIISGEAEQDSQDASITEGKESVQREVLIVDNEIDPEVSDLINNANMEMLATLVLNGEGARLIGRSSRNTELQAFLDNVPIYMQKINKVHLAAKEGNIRDLQAALDRRKFAIARDPISPNGATPLHVATVFGKTNIIKYLGGRFPETLSAVDFEGRTALHYAAVLPDNGHYYTLLQQLGANSKDLDDNGRSAEDFFKNPSLLPFDQLLSDFGLSEEAVKSMFSDKVPEDQVSSRRSLEASEALETLERCYRLLASAKPSRTPLSASSNRTTPPLVLGRFLKRPIFELIKHRITKLDHDLFDVIWPAVKKLPDSRNIVQTVEEDFPGGISAPDYYVYDVFHEFLIPLIKDIHNINVHSDLIIHPQSDFVKTTSAKLSSEPFVELNIDPNNEFVLSGTIECSRNLEGFELPLNLKVGKLETIERIMTTILMQQDFAKFSEHSNPESDQKGGLYYTLNEVLEKPSEICATLASNGLLIALCDREEIDDSTRLHGKHWPYGRGVFVSEDKTVAIWINVHDHIRVLVSTSVESPGEIGLPFSKLSYIMTYLHEKLDFVWHEKLGHLSSRPTFLGTGLRISLVVNFPGLSKDPDNMKHLCAMRGLQYRETLSPDIARISNYQCLSITETNCFNDFATASSNLLHLERDLSMQNSAHIATMLSNIFRRKRSSIIDIEAVEKPENNN
ncbi:uncharacterized protein LOC115439821 isoform X5 [Manduca sexta]|uniref:uncharacterized protein LOC115439821 isoform X5 n=1 Tax=Manduca sexta TaxID=7130 RepID=UPI001182AC3E|nr:uncharacterized protein LOC115439821 isoform X5 [Manduca sexta]